MPVSEAVQEQEARMKQWRESNDRITNPFHVQTEHFLEHKQIEGTRSDQEHTDFRCDRILNVNNAFLQFQMAYHPKQQRTFAVSRTKTSRYDTVNDDVERRIRVEDISLTMQKRRKKQETRGKKMGSNIMFFYNRRSNVWDLDVIRTFVKNNHNVSADKTIPFFTVYEERDRRKELAILQYEMREQIAEQSRESNHEENAELHEASKYYLQEENYLQMLIERKEAIGISFLRKMNFAIDIQRNEMFQYYQNEQEKELKKQMTIGQEDDEDEQE